MKIDIYSEVKKTREEEGKRKENIHYTQKCI